MQYLNDKMRKCRKKETTKERIKFSKIKIDKNFIVFNKINFILDSIKKYFLSILYLYKYVSDLK